MTLDQRSVYDEALKTFASTMAELFDLPETQVVQHVNLELKKVPLTADIELEGLQSFVWPE